MECHGLQTLHLHYKACVYITNDTVVTTFQFFNTKICRNKPEGQQYILVQNDLNKLHFTSLLQYRKLRNSILACAYNFPV